MKKPNILVARTIQPEVIARLRQHFEVESNQDDVLWTKAQFIEKLQGKQGVFTTGAERIDAELLAACPSLKICANMAVGYNNFDVPAMTAAGVLAISRAKPKSAVVSVRTSGALVASTPAVVMAGTSKLL